MSNTSAIELLKRIEARLEDMNDAAHRRVEETDEREAWDDVTATSDALLTVDDLIFVAMEENPCTQS